MNKDKLIVLANTIRQIRKDRNISQLDLSIAADIDRKTISRIENAKNEPSLETLFKISKILNYDFIAIYEKIKIEEYMLFNSILENAIKKVEIKIDISKEKKQLKNLYSVTDIEYVKLLCKQAFLFFESIDEKSNKEKILLLNQALNTMGEKDKDYTKNDYSQFELAILMNLALCYMENDNKKYIGLLEFVYKNTKKDDELFPYISNNLAKAYILYTNLNYEAFKIIDKSVKYFTDNNQIPNPLLLHTRSLAKRFIGKDFSEDLYSSKLLAEISNNNELLNIMKKSEKSFDDKYKKNK